MGKHWMQITPLTVADGSPAKYQVQYGTPGTDFMTKVEVGEQMSKLLLIAFEHGKNVFKSELLNMLGAKQT